jgi:electron transport complex protein RnfG
MAKKLENSLKNMFLSLTGISLVVGALLGWVYGVTEEPIAKANADKVTNAIKAVAPEFDQVGNALSRLQGQRAGRCCHPGHYS